MNWSEQAWTSIAPTYAAILKMPFIEELANGTLPREKFQFYMTQDALYLEHFGRALALAGARAFDIQDALSYLRFAENAIVVEHALHESFFRDFGLTEKGTVQPACHHYVHYLRSVTALEPVEVGMAATLPCFVIYKEVGDYISGGNQVAGNPYQRWIETYGGEEFAVAVHRAISICDNAAANTTATIRTRMTEAFITSSHLELDFWQAAYDVRKW